MQLDEPERGREEGFSFTREAARETRRRAHSFAASIFSRKRSEVFSNLVINTAISAKIIAVSARVWRARERARERERSDGRTVTHTPRRLGASRTARVARASRHSQTLPIISRTVTKMVSFRVTGL